MSASTIQSIIARIDTLPRLSESALRVIEALRDPEAPLNKVVDAIRFDQAITAELLRMCNSAHYSRSRKVGSLDDAIITLGATTVLHLALAAQTRTLLAPEQTGYGLAPGALWRHSIGVAIACGKLATKLPAAMRGTLFTAGLLHDIGKILLNESMAQNYAAVATRVARDRIAFPDAEREVFGFTHADVGAAVAEHWGLPEPLVRCIRHHHHPAGAGEADPLLDRVHVADVACLLMGIGGGDDGARYRADVGALRRVSMTNEGVQRLGLETVIAIKQLESACVAQAA